MLDTYPVFIAILATLFLGETLTHLKGMAIGLVIAGAFLASWHQALPGSRVKLGSTFTLLMVASLGIAVYSVLAKYSLAYLSFWHVYALSSIASAMVMALAAQWFHAWPEVRLAPHRRGSLAVTWSAHGMLFLAFITGFMAFSLGPVSLSSAVMATRPVIVLAYATLASILLPRVMAERISTSALAEKGLASALVVTGVGAMAFF